jgi:integrase/recombinase XerD
MGTYRDEREKHITEKVFYDIDRYISDHIKRIFATIDKDEIRRLKIDIENLTMLEEFITVKKMEGCNASTLYNYSTMIYNFLISINKKINFITTEDIREYMREYQKIHLCKNTSMECMRRIISTYFTWLKVEGHIHRSPTERLRKIKCEKTIKKPFTELEIAKLISACQSNRDLALIYFLNSSGVRVGELCNLDVRDIDLQECEGIVFGKGSKERIIYFDANATLYISKYLDERDAQPHEPLFITENTGKRLSKDGVSFVLNNIAQRAGIIIIGLEELLL